MKRWIAYITAASLLMGSFCTTAYGAAFADIDTVTWSGFKPFLNEAAELGLMSGYAENGKKYCKPRNNVTYCEAVQLMYSILKTYTKADVSDTAVTKWKYVFQEYRIPEWAYPAVAYALEKGILTAADLTDYKNGTLAANREDVGVLFGKAMNTLSGYSTKTGAALSYQDKAQIASASVPYLELLYRENLMVGDSDNKFNPKANITRAEMAVLSVKMYNKLIAGAPQQTTGQTATATVTSSIVMANGDLFVSLKTSSGTVLSLFGTKGKVTPTYKGDKISFSSVGVGDTVKVTYSGTTMTALEVTNSVKMATTEETFTLSEITERKVTVLDGSKEKEYRLDDDVTVKLNGKTSTIRKVQDALEDANYDVTLTLDAEEYVLKIDAVMNRDNPTEGYVTDVDDDKITIKAGSRKYTYPLADDLEIEYNGKTVKFSKFEREYDTYQYQVSMKLNQDNEVKEIQIASMEDEYNGTLTFINSNRIEFEAGGDTQKYNLDDDVTVKVDGKKSSVSALRESFRDGKAYTVSVEVNRDDDVTDILATSKFSGNNKGELYKIDADEITIVSDDKKYSYDLAKEVDVTINDKNRDVEDLIDGYKEYSYTVTLAFDKDGDVCEIAAAMEEAKEGYLRDLVEDKNTITITAGGMNLKLNMASSVTVTLGGKEITLKKLNSELDYAYGDSRIYVELGYNSSGKVKTIDAYWEDVIGTLQSVDRDEDTIDVKVDSKTKTYDVDSSADFVYQLASSVKESKYNKPSDYTETLRGLKTFLNDCEDAGDICTVVLTLEDDVVIRIKAIAE